MIRNRLLVVALVVLAAAAIAGCGGESKSSGAPAEIEEQLGFSGSSPGSIERQTRVEGRIRDCMRAQGFEYTPVDPFARQQQLTGKARLSDEEFLKQFGYGISTLFGRGNPQSDPNDRIRRSLSPPIAPPTTARSGATTRERPSPRPSTQATSASSAAAPSSQATRRSGARPC